MNKRSKQLKNFLRGKKLLTRFKLNTQLINTPFVFGKISPDIMNAFVWGLTPEGHKFWEALAVEFKEYIKVQDVKKNQHYLA